MKKIVVFDLDGTLWDATAAIAKSWNSFFQSSALDYRTTGEQIRFLAGRPYLDCLEVVTGRRDFSERFLDDLNSEEKASVCSNDGGRILAGVIDGLVALQESGFDLGIVSNCEEWYLRRFLDVSRPHAAWFVTDCFGRSKISKAQMLKRLVESYPGACVAYVGDTTGDMIAAAASSVPFIGVAYGFGAEELKKSGIELVSDFPGVVSRALHLSNKSSK